MTVELENGWAQWDYQLQTFRAEIDGAIYGAFTNDIDTVEALETRIGQVINESNKAALNTEKDSFNG